MTPIDREPELLAALARLRRRLRIERAAALLALAGVSGAWLYTARAPRVWAVYAGDRPVAAMRDREALAAVLESVRRAGGEGAEFAVPVRLARVSPELAAPVDASAAAKRLGDTLKLSARRAVIYIDDLPVVALPDRAAASGVLDRLKAQFVSGVEVLDTPPRFKERVEVREEAAEQELWADDETALGLLRGEGEEEKKAAQPYRVQPGDTAWVIARKHKLSRSELQRLNPGLRPHRLRLGQPLRVVPPPRPLVTVVTESRLTELVARPFATRTERSPRMFAGKRLVRQPGRNGWERISYRLRCENGSVVERAVLQRETVRPVRDHVVVLGTLRPGRPAGGTRRGRR